jgi:hypothetical protein
MTQKQLAQWQSESIEQAYEALENDLLIQYSGFVSYGCPEDN